MYTSLIKMKNFFTLIVLLFSLAVNAQTAEKEPNNTFATGNGIKMDSIKTGTVNGTSDLSDFFRTETKNDGTLKIVINGTNTGLSNGYLYFTAYDGRNSTGQFIAKYIGNTSNVGGGKSITDTILFYGLASDSVYFRFIASGTFSYSMMYSVLDTSTNDVEQNGTFGTALNLNQLVEKKGHINYQKAGATDQLDYYKTKLNKDGTLKIVVSGKNQSGRSAYLYFSVYDGRKSTGQIFARYITGASIIQAGSSYTDTMLLYGRGIDSVYFRFDGSGAHNYSVKYDIIDTSSADLEPNSIIQNATNINQMEEKKGHVHYSYNGTVDFYDFYKTKFEKDGTVKIYVTGTNRSGGNGYLYMYGYDGRKLSGQIVARYISGSSNVVPNKFITDTIVLYGRGVDSFYFRMEASDAFEYSVKYDISDTSAVDIEPNNIVQEATNINQLELKKGHIRYAFNGNVDSYDYYRTKLNKDGTLKLYVTGINRSGGNGFLYMYGYDGRKLLGQILGRYISGSSNVVPNKLITDTIILYGRGIDSFYFRMEASSAFEYTVKYDVIDTSSVDIEPNNIVQEATNINQLELKKGHIRYASNGTSDFYDYYKTKLKKDGTLKIYVTGTNRSGGNAYLFMYGYDGRKLSGQILARYISGSSNIPPNKFITDTITMFGRGIDSFYFRMEASEAFEYTVKYDIIDTSANDLEPNPSFAITTLTKVGNNHTGHIGYAFNGTRDNDDFYKMPVPKTGTLEIYTEATNYSGGNGYIFLYGYDSRKGGGQIVARYLGNTSNMINYQTLRDTIRITCLLTDTFYMNFLSTGGFSYKFKTKFIDRRPTASTENERIGNTVGFRPQFANATGFSWDFGDGTKSTVQYPLKSFKFGFYKTKLIVVNSVCNLRDTAEEDFEFKGIEYYTPKKGGAGGDALMQIFGGGLDTSTIVKLVKGTTVIEAEEKYTNSIRNQLSAVLDLHFATPGVYDVEITVPGQSTVTYPGGFVIEGLKYPYTWSEVQGPSRFRTNVDTRFNLVIGNKGNVVASGVVLALVWPKDVTITFEDKFITPPDTGFVEVKLDGDAQTYRLARKEYHFIYDSLNTTTPIDSFAGKPYNGYIRYLLIPHVPVGSTIELPFIARTKSTQLNKFITYTHKPNMWGSCHTKNWTDYNDDITAELIDGADMIVDKTKIPLLKAFTKTAKIGQKHGASAATYLGKHFWAWYDGYEVDENEAMGDWLRETEANNAFALQTATDELGGLMLNKGIGKLNSTYQKQVDFINKRLANNPNMSAKLTEAYLDKLNKISGANKRLNGLKEMLDNTKNLGTLSDKLVKLQQMVADCPELQQQLDDLIKGLEKELDQQDVRTTNSNSATSFDPNEITGPIGFGAERYLNSSDRHRFMVSFENVDTATAAAQIVRIKDTLDKSKFDLSTFEFGDVSVGTKNFRIPKSRKQFVIERHLTGNINVRINGELDTVKGIISWQFTAIDTNTKDLPVFEGFLPPNVSKPEGEGSCSYSVMPKLPVLDGTVYTNRASIVFDDNEPILTNTWKNIADVLPPTSTLKANILPGHTDIQLIVNANDATSGVGYKNLFVKQGTGAWVAFGGSSADTIKLEGEPGKTYSFYVVSGDKVGNMELKNPVAEANIVVGYVNPLAYNQKLVLRPNPASTVVTIDGLKKFKSYQITDMTGRLIINEKVNTQTEQIDIRNLQTGMYIITVYGDTVQSLKLMKQ